MESSFQSTAKSLPRKQIKRIGPNFEQLMRTEVPLQGALKVQENIVH